MSRKFSNDWFTHQIPLFNNFLFEFKNKDNIKFLEVGTFEGQAACWCLDNILKGNNNKITCIDNWIGGFEHYNIDMSDIERAFLSNISDRFNDVEVLKGLSRECLLKIQDRKNYYNFIYIDGGHSLKDTITDTVLAFDLLIPGGIMAFDDYQWGLEYQPHKRPKQAIDCFLSGWQDEIEILHKNYQVWIRKI